MSHQVSYSKLFAPPKFLAMPSVAVEILPNALRFFSTKNTEQGLLPDKYGQIDLEERAIVRGEIKKPEVVLKALKEIRRTTGLNFARFSIPEEKTYIFKTQLPNLEPKEIRDVLDFKLEENVPLSSKEAVFDFDIVSNHKISSDIEVVTSVAPLKFIEEWQNIFVAADLLPVLFVSESSNVARSVIHVGNQQTVVTVNIKEATTIFSLVVSGTVYQTSSINFGSSTFTDLFCKYYKISPAEALKLQKEKLYSSHDDNMEVFSYLINTISAIKDELSKFILYCNEREDVATEIDRVVLSGQEAMIIGLAEYLSLNLDLRVDIADIWTNNFKIAEYVPEIGRVESMNYSIVNGLSLY
ncbi:MAG: pilus assembly protein PilM [Candidatus Paceibacterota bacterium]